MLLMWIVSVLAAAVVVAALGACAVAGGRAAVVRAPAGAARAGMGSLEQRLVRGEITAAEFRQLRAMVDAARVDGIPR